MAGQGSAGNVIAAACSFFFPGLGQLVQGRILSAFLFFISTTIFYWVSVLTFGLFLIVALPVHLWCIINAARYKAA